MKHKTHIKTWLKNQKLSAIWLGQQLGLGQTQAADIVSGRKPASVAQRIAIEHITNGAVARDQWGA